MPLDASIAAAAEAGSAAGACAAAGIESKAAAETPETSMARVRLLIGRMAAILPCFPDAAHVAHAVVDAARDLPAASCPIQQALSALVQRTQRFGDRRTSASGYVADLQQPPQACRA